MDSRLNQTNLVTSELMKCFGGECPSKTIYGPLFSTINMGFSIPIRQSTVMKPAMFTETAISDKSRVCDSAHNPNHK